MDHRNPEKHRLIVPYAIYSTYKNATKQIQNQREQVQHTILYLER